VNGITVIDARVKWNPSTPAQSTPLENRLTTTFGQRFTGTATLIERASWLPPEGFPGEVGPIKLQVGWPDEAIGKTETILATGPDGAKNFLQIKYESRGQVRFFAITGQKVVLDSGPVSITPGARQELKVAWGGLDLDAARPPQVSLELWRDQQSGVVLWLDGKQVLAGRMDFTRTAPQDVSIGGGGPETPPFSGLIYEVRREPSAP
jgi:hypothetical protein